MKQTKRIALAALAGGIAALVLRIWNLRAGFEEGTGLPVSGNPSFPSLLITLALVLLSLLLLSRHLSEHGNPRFPFHTQRKSVCMLLVAGAFLLALSGAADLFESFSNQRILAASRRYAYIGLIDGEAVGMSTGVQCASGLLTLLSAWAVFECARACLSGTLRFRALVLLPAVSMSFRLVTLYRIDSVNPVLENYAPGLVALVFQVMGFYAFSAFLFESGDLRHFAVAAGGALTMALCVLVDKVDYISTPLMLCGSAASLTGLLLLALEAPPVPKTEEAG